MFTKEQLVEMGLTDEQADKVIEGYGQMIPKSRLDTKIQEVNDLKGQLADRDTQLEALKKVDVKALQTTITDLQTANETAKAEYEAQLKQRDFDHALDGALRDAKARNIKGVRANLDLDAIKLDGDKLLGLDEQLTALKASDDYLFVKDGLRGQTPPNPDGGGKWQSQKNSSLL